MKKEIYLDIYSDTHIHSWIKAYKKMSHEDFYLNGLTDYSGEHKDVLVEKIYPVFAGDASSSLCGPEAYFDTIQILENIYQKQVLASPGNHDFYYQRYKKLTEEELTLLKSLYVPKTGTIFLSDDRQILTHYIEWATCPLFTNFRNDEDVSKYNLLGLNDFVFGRNEDGEILRPQDYQDHYNYYKNNILDDIHNIIVTHFPPTLGSLDPKYGDKDDPANKYFVNDDPSLMDDEYTHIWIHGHTHTPFDYMVGNTRIVSNPIGYYGENSRNPSFIPKRIKLEIKI